MTSPSFDDRVRDGSAQMSPPDAGGAIFPTEPRGGADRFGCRTRQRRKPATPRWCERPRRSALPGSSRRDLAAELRRSLSLAERLTRTLDEVRGSGGCTRGNPRHPSALARQPATQRFTGAVRGSGRGGCRRRPCRVFGLGPSAAIAQYLVTQLIRFGFRRDRPQPFRAAVRRRSATPAGARPRDHASLWPGLCRTGGCDKHAGRRLRSCLITDTLAMTLRISPIWSCRLPRRG